MAQAVVIGGGVVGLCIAIGLLDRGLTVTLVDAPSPERPASWGNAGHIAIEQVAPLASYATIRNAPQRLMSRHGGLSLPLGSIGQWAPFGWRLMRAAGRYPAGKTALAALLAEATPAWQRLVEALGEPQLLRRDGHFITWSSVQAAAAGRLHWLNTDIGEAGIRDADRDELEALRRLSPDGIAGALRFVGTGQIHDPDALLEALTRRVTAAGGHIVRTPVVRLPTSNGKAGAQLADGSVLAADFIVVAAGVGSASLLAPLGHRVPLIAERGYHLQYAATDWPADMPPVVFEDRAMIATRFAATVRVAGFVEFANAKRPPNRRKWRRLAQDVEELRLPLGRHSSEWMGARPTLPDYLPAIGRSGTARNLLYAFGHQHLGLTLAPVTGEIVAALATGRPAAVALAPFDLARFR